jgi:hypothetical protein
MSMEAMTVDLVWRKSSRSGQDGSNGNCVEVAWRKSSRSGQNGSNGNCVEVAFSGPSVVVRDSKSPGQGTIAVPQSGWTGFLRVAKM